MSTVTRPHEFTPGTSIKSAEVNANFSTLYDDYNGSIANVNISGSAAIGNAKLANPNSYFTVCINKTGQYTSSLDPVATFQMPAGATLVEVSASARDLDVAGTNAYTVDLEDDGTSALSSAIALVADNTPVVGTIANATVADDSKMEVVLTLSGDTTPALDDLTVLITFKVGHIA